MEKLAEGIFKINVDSNVYLVDDIVVDTGPPNYREEVKQRISEIMPLDKIKKVIFTHLHYDHVGNFDLFSNAEFYASPEEIEYFKKHKIKALLHPIFAVKFNVELKPLTTLEGFDIIKTPGHTSGGICLLHKKTKILFSGDTLFQNGYGRVDFPNSNPEDMEKSLKKLQEIKYKILAPGHDY